MAATAEALRCVVPAASAARWATWDSVVPPPAVVCPQPLGTGRHKYALASMYMIGAVAPRSSLGAARCCNV
jgi:hypothetical protein